jgi:SulP family sulfate permease
LIRDIQTAIVRAFRNLVAFFANNRLDPLPILADSTGYSAKSLKADLIAGLNVALLAIPQGMAYAVIADVPIHYGIVCGAVAAFVAAHFSGSRHTVLGPTNATSFMVFGFFAFVTPEFKEDILPLVVFLVGILLIAGAYFRVADLIQYISRSVVVGYITGASVLIIANQLRHVFGISFDEGSSPRTFFSIAWQTIKNLGGVDPQTFFLSLLAVSSYFILKRKLRGWPVFAITLALTSVVYAILNILSHKIGWLAVFEIEAFREIKFSDLKPRIPRFTQAGIFDDIAMLFGLAFSIAFLAALENSVMSKTLGSRTGDRPDANQDMFAIGISNLATSFFSVMPSSGSLTRSQLNYSSGAKTRLAGAFSGVFCALGAVLLATPAWFGFAGIMQFIPKCALAALVIVIATSLINPHYIRICLRATRSDAAVLVVTFLATLITPLHVAIFLGVAISIMLYLHKASRPELVEYDFTDEGELSESETGVRRDPLISIVHVEGELFFGAAELFRNQIQRTCLDPNLRVLILRMRNARRLDATSVIALEDLIKFLESTGRHLIVSGATQDVYRVLLGSGVLKTVGEDNIFMHSAKNPNLSTRDALKRAQQLLGTTKAEIRIFYDPNAPKPD